MSSYYAPAEEVIQHYQAHRNRNIPTENRNPFVKSALRNRKIDIFRQNLRDFGLGSATITTPLNLTDILSDLSEIYIESTLLTIIISEKMPLIY